MKCKKCGEELPDRARFCLICGTPVDQASESPADETPESDAPAVLEKTVAMSTLPEEGGAVEPASTTSDADAADGEPAVDAAKADAADDEASPDGAEAVSSDESADHSEETPSPKKLEEPLEAAGLGAVSLVPVAPPPRAARAHARAPRAHARAPRPYLSQGDHRPRPERLSIHDAPSWAEHVPSHAPKMDAAAEGSETSVEHSAQHESSSHDGEGTNSLGELLKDFRNNFTSIDMTRNRLLVIGALACAAVLVVAFLGVFATSWIGPFAPKGAEIPQVQPPSNGSIEPLEASDDEEEAETEELPEGAPEVRDAVEDYSWEELSQISELIAAASSDDDALSLAERYGLCGPDGELDGTQSKTLELGTGTEVTMRVAGFRQDQKSDGSGAAGITFVAQNSAGSHTINYSGQLGNGWQDSDMRTYLNEDLLAQLPDDLSSVIVEVKKHTNRVLGTGEGQAETDDKLWLPSYSEVVGQPGSGSNRASAYRSEGEQYRLYKDLGVTWNSGGSKVSLPDEYWWLRSPEVVNTRWYMIVAPDGAITYGHRPGTENAIILGFCV